MVREAVCGVKEFLSKTCFLRQRKTSYLYNYDLIRVPGEMVKMRADAPVLLWAAVSIFTVCVARSDAQTTHDLLDELGCAGCHQGLPAATVVTERAPGLSDAGVRFRSAYLFEYMQRPVAVRRGIGSTRMPDYGFTAREALALTLFLSERRQSSDAHVMPAGLATPSASAGAERGIERLITEYYDCVTCHTLDGHGGDTASELRGTGSRLTPDWILRFLLEPDTALRGIQTMPSFFFVFDHGNDAYQSLVPNALSDLQNVAEYLAADTDGTRTALEQSYAAALAWYTGTTAEEGERLFRAQRCGACHGTVDGAPSPQTAPDLSLEGARVRRAWLEDYLLQTRPIRPTGAPIGSGARMPDYGLAEDEARTLADQLMAITRDPILPGEESLSTLSRFSMTKARRIVEEQLACLGCHRLGGEGGVIGPDLSSLGERLLPEFVQRFVENPHSLVPDTVMPAPGLSASDAELTIRFLLQQTLPLDSPRYLELSAPMLVEHADGTEGERLYRTYCAACHGPEGRGDGFNAAHLATVPQDFTDASYMSTRPDDTLFDGIAAGGRILGKSHHMPAWGGTLSDEDIAALVRHLRALCECVGPDWSRDGRMGEDRAGPGAIDP